MHILQNERAIWSDALAAASARRLIGSAQPETESGFGEDVMRALGIGHRSFAEAAGHRHADIARP